MDRFVNKYKNVFIYNFNYFFVIYCVGTYCFEIFIVQTCFIGVIDQSLGKSQNYQPMDKKT